MRGHVEPYKRKVDGEWRAVRGRWKGVIDLDVPKGAARARETFYFDGGKKEAQAELGDRMARLRRTGGAVSPVHGTVGEWLDEWLSLYVEPRVRDGERAASTLSSYRGVVRRYLKPALKDTDLKRLKPEDVTRLYLDMGKPKAEGGHGVSPRTRELAHVVLRAALGKAVELGRLRVNVLERGRGVDRPKVARREVTALEPEQAVALLSKLAAAEGADARIFLPAYIALATGMRRGEVLALRWDDVKLPAKSETDALGVITVARAWDCNDVRGRLPIERYRVKMPKNGRPRYVDVGPEVVSVLRSAKADQASARLAAGETWFTQAKRSDGSVLEWGDLVVTDGHGFPLWPNSFSSMWRAWCQREKVVCRFHDLRATSLSIALASGADPEAVRQRAGHHSAAFFLERYAKAMHRAREKDAGIIGALVGQVPVAHSGTKSGHQRAGG
jgi:integrase